MSKTDNNTTKGAYSLTMKNLEDLREQIQDDLITIMDSQFGEVEYVEEAKDMLCQAVVDRIKPLIEKRETMQQVAGRHRASGKA